MAAAVHTYHYGGRVVAAPVALPELQPAPGPPVDVTVDVLVGPPAEVDWSTDLSPEADKWFRCGEPRHGVLHLGHADPAIVLEFADEGGAVIEPDGRRVGVWREAGLSDVRFRHLVLNQVLAYALAVQGTLVLHGAAVVFGSRAVAFLGRTGMGKSTLAASFGVAGHPLLTDDAVIVDDPGGVATVQPSYPAVRLWDTSAAALLGRPRQDPVKHVVSESELPFRHDPAPLAAVFLIVNSADDDPGHVGAHAVGKAAATLTLLGHCFHPRGSAKVNAAMFARVSDLAETVPLWQLSVPDDLDRLKAVRGVVADCLA